MPSFRFDAHVTAALFDGDAALFALADGRVAFEDGAESAAHPEAGVLSAAAGPRGEGVVTGGDDGRLVWTRAGAAPQELLSLPGRWIDAVAVSAEGLAACAAGREAVVVNPADPAFRRTFTHERTVADLAFDAKGKRLATATYGGAKLWWARVAEQKPQSLTWAGSHIGLAWSPDGRILISSMQENALHGWRLADGKDMRMGGYPAKVRSIAFAAGGLLMVTSGARGVVVWPFGGQNGPMGQAASEVGVDENSFVTRVAGHPKQPVVAAGCSDGRVWVADLRRSRLRPVKAAGGAAISALALRADGARLAFGDEDGHAEVVDTPEI